MTTERVNDKVNIVMTKEANDVANQLEELGYFEDKLDIAKFGFAYAIEHGVDREIEQVEIGEGRGASWNVGSFDGNKELYSLVLSLFPDISTPYRYVELLMNAGLIRLGQVIQESGLRELADYM